MKLEKLILPVLCLMIGFTACKKDDDTAIEVIPLRDRKEQQLADNDSIVKYLKSHYYNAGTFVSNPNASTKDLIISLVDGDIPDPDNNKLLFGAAALETKQVVFAETNYEIYILRLNEGGGVTPTFADNVRVNYEGFTLDNAVFDSSANPTVFDLTAVISGWRKVMPLFKTADSAPVENGDGTVSYTNHGVGVMFIPSGLAYFASGSTGIASYTPIAFKFDLFEMEENDHDNDGVPSYKEDLNGDGEFLINSLNLKDETDDDTDGDGTPNIGDADDDGDGIPTIREDINKDGDPTNDDSNGNGIPNYLDKLDTLIN
jgi:FKBP-type peptidyl-prolyl cis-trans isomerase FkpA